MLSVFIVCNAILAISIFGMGISAICKRDGLFTLFLVILILDVLFGFGCVASCGNWKGDKVDVMVPEEIARSQYTIFIKCQGQTYQTSDVRFFSAPDSAIRIERVEGQNAYGASLGNPQIRIIILEENR